MSTENIICEAIVVVLMLWIAHMVWKIRRTQILESLREIIDELCETNADIETMKRLKEQNKNLEGFASQSVRMGHEE